MNRRTTTTIKHIAIATTAALSLGGAASADGFSAELDLPANPFTANLALHHTYEILPNWFVGTTARTVYGPFGDKAALTSTSRVGSNYVFNLVDAGGLKADAYVGAGLLVNWTDNFRLTPDVNAGARATYSVDSSLKVYGGVDAQASLVAGSITPNVFGYVGGKFEPMSSLEVYAQAGVGYSSAFNYDLKLGAYFTVLPELRLGASVGYDGDFRANLGLQFALKPGTLATPGNFLP